MPLVTPEIWYRLFWVCMAIAFVVALHAVAVRPIVTAIQEGRSRSMHEQERRGFRLEITSLEEFAAFVAIIRGDDLDDEKLSRLTARLRKSTTDLDKAVKANAEP